MNDSHPPLVSVYWISMYRPDWLVESIRSFRASTNYPNLELIVVDASSEPRGAETRSRIKSIEGLDKIILRDQHYCEWNNGNRGFEASVGDFIIGFEDDIAIKPNVPKDWIEKSIDLLLTKKFSAVNYFGNSSRPNSVGFMASRKIREKWGPWKQYPDDFKTITESQVLGDKHRLSWFVGLGLTCANMDILLTSMTAPSSNLVKLSTILRVKPEELDALANEGVTVTRLDNKNYNYVSSDGYDELGWWRGCEFRISGGLRLVYNYWGSRTALAYLAHRISAKQLRLSLSLKAWLKRRLGRQRFFG